MPVLKRAQALVWIVRVGMFAHSTVCTHCGMCTVERIAWFDVAPFREVRFGMAQLAPERSEPMRKVKDLEAVFAQLRAEAARGGIEPRQKQLLEQAIETLKRFRRIKNPTKAEIFRCVRDVAEKLLEAFLI